MRVYGRITNDDGSQTWVVVQTDANGNNDAVYITALIQDLKLNLNESPFYANNGIPAQQSVITQIFPDFYALAAQAQYAQYFSSLIISSVAGVTAPTYDIQLVTHNGVNISLQVPG